MKDVLEDFRVSEAPYWRETGDEITLFTAAWDARIPVMLKGRQAAAKPGLSNT